MQPAPEPQPAPAPAAQPAAKPAASPAARTAPPRDHDAEVSFDLERTTTSVARTAGLDGFISGLKDNLDLEAGEADQVAIQLVLVEMERRKCTMLKEQSAAREKELEDEIKTLHAQQYELSEGVSKTGCIPLFTVILNFLADENQVWWFKVVSCALAVIGNVFFPAITGAGNVGAGFVAIVGAVLGFVVGCVLVFLGLCVKGLCQYCNSKGLNIGKGKKGSAAKSAGTKSTSKKGAAKKGAAKKGAGKKRP